MKKIIELADIYSESVKNNESVFLQVKKKKELLVAIREYHTLQAIPITEDWLKEEGDYLIAYRINDYRELDKIYMQTASYHKEEWHPNAKYNGMQILAWRIAPELPKEE